APVVSSSGGRCACTTAIKTNTIRTTFATRTVFAHFDIESSLHFYVYNRQPPQRNRFASEEKWGRAPISPFWQFKNGEIGARPHFSYPTSAARIACPNRWESGGPSARMMLLWMMSVSLTYVAPASLSASIACGRKYTVASRPASSFALARTTVERHIAATILLAAAIAVTSS